MDNLRKGIEELLKQTKVEEVDDGKEKEVEEEKVEEEVEETKKTFTYEESLDYLAEEEERAIKEYDEVIDTLEEKEIVEELKRIRAEEVAHLEFLRRAKTDKAARYEDPEK